MVQLRERLEDSTDSELTRDPSLMARDRGKAAAMIERSIDHRGVYKIAEDNFNELLDSRRDEVEDIIRELMLARGIIKPTQDTTIGDEIGEHLNGAKEVVDEAKMSDMKMDNGMVQDDRMQDVGMTNGVEYKEVGEGTRGAIDIGNEVDVKMSNGMMGA
ncbi:hypothetical protein BDD12DRAFT_446743 [Trichophaea hybrida]|nr:hypothetical protein BDD12DRAFT_446743 [Trichophaea hybrida]